MHVSPLQDPSAGTRFLDPKTLAAIGNLELLARTVVEGFLHGLHRSPRIGLSMEFAEHRPYMPGDDIRRIDWRVFGRTDRFYLKEYEAETNASVSILLDVSPSMAFGTGAVTKLDYGRFIAACLAYFSSRQRDRIGLVTFGGDLVEVIPPSTRHLTHVLHVLERIQPRAAEGGGLARPLTRIAEQVRRRSVLVIISDFYGAPDEVVAAINRLRSTGSDVLAFHLLDPAEIDFPYDLAASFEDLETGERLPVVPEDLRNEYRRMIEEHLAELDRKMASHRVDYTMVDLSRPLDFVLLEYLMRRHALSRVR